MLCIDRLIHFVHSSLDHLWTKPAAENLIFAKGDEIAALLDELAGIEPRTEERRAILQTYRQQRAASRVVTQNKEEKIRRRLFVRGIVFKKGK